MLSHHAFGVLSFGALIVFEKGHACGLTGALMEATNLFTNLRTLLDKFEFKDSVPMLYLINGLFFTISFFVLRILYFSYAGYHVLYKNWQNFDEVLSTPLKICIIVCYAVGQGLQYFWFTKIWSGFVKVLARTFKSGDKEV